jgi:hypothetical protein
MGFQLGKEQQVLNFISLLLAGYQQQMLIIQISLVCKLVWTTNAQYSTFIGQLVLTATGASNSNFLVRVLVLCNKCILFKF